MKTPPAWMVVAYTEDPIGVDPTVSVVIGDAANGRAVFGGTSYRTKAERRAAVEAVEHALMHLRREWDLD